MELKIETNAAEVGRWLAGAEKKMRQAAKAALSKTALQVQHAERVELNREFTIRKAAFMRNRVKIKQFPSAKEGGLVAIIGIDEKVKGSPLLLSVFEEGGAKNPIEGSRVAIPLTGGKARPEFRKSVPASMRLDRLGLHSQINRKGKGGAVIGDKRTFLLPTKKGEYALFQRGPGARTNGPDKDIQPIYLFRNTVRLKKRLKFVRIARELASEQLPKLYSRYLRLYIKQR